jgi:hypothetical protein
MHKRTILVLAVIAGSLGAQNLPRRATIRNFGGDPNRGKCTIEVVVDGIAEVEVRGDSAVLRTITGQPATWRRFECNMPMSGNPAEFRFAGVDGRGRQTLIREPGQGGPAVMRIEDPQSGAEGYTFDLFWRAGFDGPPVSERDRGRDRPDFGGRRFTTEQAVRVCQDAVRQQAMERFRAPDITFRATTLDDNPGRSDWVKGTFQARRREGRDELYAFSCAVNFDTGRVRSAQVDPLPEERYDRGREGDAGNNRAIQGCQRAVSDRLRNDGYGRVEFRSINVDDRPGRNDRIIGVVRAEGQRGGANLEFSCSVDLRDGDVKSVDVRSGR